MNLILPALSILLLAFLSLAHWKRQKDLSRLYWPALLVKLTGGICVGLVYKYYYAIGDTFGYFSEGSILADVARTNFAAYMDFLWSSTGLPNLADQVPRALFLSKVTSVFNLISGNNYWITACYFSFMSFMGAWFLVTQVAKSLPNVSLSAAIAFLFIPSVIFWTSGLIKESLAAAGLFYLSGIFLKLWFRQKLTFLHGAIALLSLWMVWKLKYYFIAIFFPVFIAGMAYRFITVKFPASKKVLPALLIWLAIFILPLAIVTLIHPNFYPHRLLSVIVDNYQAFVQVSNEEDMVKFDGMQPTVASLVIHSPAALVAGLFRPFLWEAGTFFQALVALENLCVFFISLIALFRIREVLRSEHRMLVFTAWVYIILLCVLITLSTPNFGTLVRYRVGYWPFFVFIVLCAAPLTRFIQRSLPNLVRY